MSDSDNPIIDQNEKIPSPDKCVGGTLRPSAGSRENSSEAKEPITPKEVSSQPVTAGRLSFGKFVHNYVWGNVLLAEQKAAFIFAADTAFVGYLITKIPSQFGHLAKCEQAAIVLTLLFMGLSVVSAVMVIVPRLGGDLRGLIYFKAVASRPAPEAYTREVLRASVSELDAETMQHNYEMAKICFRKFEFVRWAIWLGLCGFGTGLVWLWVAR